MAEQTKVDETKVDEVKTDVEEENPTASEEKKYTDKQLNDISKKNVAKAEAKLLKSLGVTNLEEAKKILKAVKHNDENAADNSKKELQQITQRAVKAEIKNVLAEKGFIGKKADRMLNLLNLTDCLNDDGEIDASKVEQELEGVKADFPELFSKQEESTGFKFGSEGETKMEKVNQKPPENRKRWNRFN